MAGSLLVKRLVAVPNVHFDLTTMDRRLRFECTQAPACHKYANTVDRLTSVRIRRHSLAQVPKDAPHRVPAIGNPRNTGYVIDTAQTRGAGSAMGINGRARGGGAGESGSSDSGGGGGSGGGDHGGLPQHLPRAHSGSSGLSTRNRPSADRREGPEDAAGSGHGGRSGGDHASQTSVHA